MKGRSDKLDVIIGHSLRNARRVRRVSRKELGARIGVSYQQLQKYETGQNRLPVSRLLKIAAVLGQPVEQLLADAQVVLTGTTTIHRSMGTAGVEIDRLAAMIADIADEPFRDALIQLVERHVHISRG